VSVESIFYPKTLFLVCGDSRLITPHEHISLTLQLLSSLNEIFQHAVALRSIFSIAGITIIRCKPWELKQPLTWFLGTSKPEEGYAVLPSHDESRPQSDGRTIVILAILDQCIASVFLYHRRAGRNADAIIACTVCSAAISDIGICIPTLGVVTGILFFFTKPLRELEYTAKWHETFVCYDLVGC
jgi:hypothetical protein